MSLARWRARRRPLYADRTDAGERLGARLVAEVNAGALVLGLSRGGVPVAVEAARALDAELDVLVVRKVGAPRQAELALGAVTAGGEGYLDTALIERLGVTELALNALVAGEQADAARRERRLRGDRPFPRVEQREVIIVDDGLATGATMRAALRSLRRLDPGELIVAVPVGARSTCTAMSEVADRCICLEAPSGFRAVGQFYEDFAPVSDDEVAAILDQFRADAESG